MSYNGWNILDKVILVRKRNKQAYVVDPSNKKQLESAKKWGNETEVLRDKNNNAIYDSEKHEYKVVEYPAEVITLENSGFTVELLEAANCSSQGGKLSFWNCLLSKDNEEYIVGINSELLLDLLKQSTFINGKCKETVSFARKCGNVGLLHSSMKEYQEALGDKQIRESNNKGKTKKWQVGHNYTTLSKNDIYLGKVFTPIKVEYDCIYNLRYDHGVPSDILNKACEQYRHKFGEYKGTFGIYNNYPNIHLYTISIDKKRQSHITESYDNLTRKIHNNDNTEVKLHDIIRKYKEKIENAIKTQEDYDFYNVEYCNPYVEKSLDKLPSRKQGSIDMQLYSEYTSDVVSLLDLSKDYALFNLDKLSDEQSSKQKSQLSSYEPSIGTLSNIIRSVDGSITDKDIDIIKRIVKALEKQTNKINIYRFDTPEENKYEYILKSDELVDRIIAELT